jgi:hypothetical protein
MHGGERSAGIEGGKLSASNGNAPDIAARHPVLFAFLYIGSPKTTVR